MLGPAATFVPSLPLGSLKSATRGRDTPICALTKEAKPTAGQGQEPNPQPAARRRRTPMLSSSEASVVRRRAAAEEPGRPGNSKFAQPCALFDGCRCRIYGERPAYCRKFECSLLKRVNAGQVRAAAALRIIRSARRRVNEVKALLHKLGDRDEHIPLRARFRRMKHRFEAGPPDDPAAELFGRLTLSVHDLNVLLSDEFYPGNKT